MIGLLVVTSILPLGLGACSTNPATGEQQFTALMPASQERQIGASEHEKIVQQFGLYNDPAVVSYVNEIGRKVAQDTERPDVSYKFYVLDSPIVNAFALPGGYIYISRGLLALANSEAEVAAVLSHEVGHITGRHSAERYSTGVVTSLGASILSAAIDKGGASQAIGLGANLYLSSYSRSQENEADTLGLRYMTRGGYHPDAMGKFLNSLRAQSSLDAQLAGKSGAEQVSYLSTHPATSDRVAKTVSEAGSYADQGEVGHEKHLRVINGMIYGDSADQGFARGQAFYHPKLGFMFEAPPGYNIVNQPTQVVASGPDGAIMIFDMAGNKGGLSAGVYLRDVWMKNEPIGGLESVVINGMKAATAAFNGRVNNQPMTIRLIAIEFKPDMFARFQIAIPQGVSGATLDGLKRASYSFRALGAGERTSLKPPRIALVAAKSGDSAGSLAARMSFDTMREERFRVLNGLAAGEAVQAGRLYKVVVE